MPKPKALVLTGYGINCEEETSYAFEQSGAICDIVHINDLIDKTKKFKDYQILAFPGGFSYGDDTGGGKAFANRVLNNLKEEVLQFIERDTLTIGICNGFQIMTLLGLVPALDGKYGERQVALMSNTSARYICRWARMKNVSSKCVFTKGIDTFFAPVAHAEGNLFANDEDLKKMQANDQIVFQYCNEDKSLADGEFPANPNGSVLDIAAVCDPTGRIMGMMPHPERHLFFSNRPDFALEKERLLREGKDIPQEGGGYIIFKNAVEYFCDKDITNNPSSVGLATTEDLSTGMTYKEAGVDIEKGDKASEEAYGCAKSTFASRAGMIGEPVVKDGGFSGLIDMGEYYLTQSCDTVGTKIEIADKTGIYSGLGYDLLAMVADDIVCTGAETISITNTFETNVVNPENIKRMVDSLAEACQKQKIVIVGGEVAEVGEMTNGTGWGADAVGIIAKNKVITGDNIQPGDKIVGFRSNIFRCNGFSLIRKILGDSYGENWVNVRFDSENTWGEIVLAPSVVYSAAVLDMIGRYQQEPKADIKGIAHITGGGVTNVKRILKAKKLGARLTSLFAPHEAMLTLQRMGNVQDEEAYKTWNMGTGMMIVSNDTDKVIEIAAGNNIQAQVVGEVTDNEDTLELIGKAYYNNGSSFKY